MRKFGHLYVVRRDAGSLVPCSQRGKCGISGASRDGAIRLLGSLSGCAARSMRLARFVIPLGILGLRWIQTNSYNKSFISSSTIVVNVNDIMSGGEGFCGCCCSDPSAFFAS